MPAQIYSLPVHPDVPNRPSWSARIGIWHEFDVVGASLPKRSYAAEWNVARVMLGLGGIVSTIGLGLLMFRVAEIYLIAVIGGLGYPARCLAKHYKKRLFRRALGESDPEDPVLGVSYRIDEFEYGRDVGRLCFENGWLFFEGERSSFSLGPQDVETRFVNWSFAAVRAIYGNSGHSELLLKHAGRRVKVRFEPISSKEYVLRRELRNWCLGEEVAEGIALLPPLAPNPRGDFARSPRWMSSLKFGVIAAYFMALFWGWFSADVRPEFALAGAAGLSGVVWDRFRVRRARAEAFRQLSSIQTGIEGRYARAGGLES